MISRIRVCGVSRIEDNDKGIAVYFDRNLSDDELRQFHEHCREFVKFDWHFLQALRKSSA